MHQRAIPPVLFFIFGAQAGFILSNPPFSSTQTADITTIRVATIASQANDQSSSFVAVSSSSTEAFSESASATPTGSDVDPKSQAQSRRVAVILGTVIPGMLLLLLILVLLLRRPPVKSTSVSREPSHTGASSANWTKRNTVGFLRPPFQSTTAEKTSYRLSYGLQSSGSYRTTFGAENGSTRLYADAVSDVTSLRASDGISPPKQMALWRSPLE
ncbi:hypothetical protein C8J57DRAFT_1296641 [Mycena rebaudengoi]|nr:hypothetical protein C8J57DRAFT_1296641 [Mycena rebaudengoi]